MAKKEKLTDRLKEGISVEHIEKFAHKYVAEVFTALAIVIASISSSYDFFTGPKMSLMLGGLSVIIAIFLPHKIDAMCEKFYEFSNKQEKALLIILGIVKLIVALFIPFIVFIGLGFLAGISYHHYNKHAQGNRGSSKGGSGGGHV